MSFDDREQQTRPYDWNRIATDAALVTHLEKLGGKIIDPKRRPAGEGFRPPEPPREPE